MLPLPTLSSYPLSLGIQHLYWPSSWKSKEGKGGARPGSRDGVVRFGKQEVALFSQLCIWRQPVLQAQVSSHLALRAISAYHS